MKLNNGDVLQSVGGWTAQIIWIRRKQQGFYAIHKPNTEEESVPIYHSADGTAHPMLSLYGPPTYGQKHPADLILKE